MAFDYKKGYKEFYMPAASPEIVRIPAMNYLAVRGVGDPNEEAGAPANGNPPPGKKRAEADA